ncbi:hypothetical protein [Bradyrhizobium sp. ORS 111]|uniref:hypothetical protein n=1 Tax=Bradyrhizobium sp. ORS 111 TaxID=1685958 RepID=UPI0038901548
MLQRLIDDAKQSAGNALRLTSLAGAIAVALFITIVFLCAAAFVFVLQHYGPVEACLAAAALFFVITLIAAVAYTMRKREMKRHAEKMAKAAAANAFTDPVVIATGLQIVRAIGAKRLIPILAVAGLALGLMVSRAEGNRKQAEE